MTVYIDLNLSGVETTLTNPVVEITLPSQHISYPLITIPEVPGATHTLTQSGGLHILRFTFDQLSGGTATRIPLVVSTNPYRTPDMTEILMNASLKSESGELLKQANELLLTNRVIQRDMRKTIVSTSSNNPTDNQNVFAGLSNPNDPTRVSDNINETSVIVFSFKSYVYSEGYNNTVYGARTYSNFEIKDRIPDEATFLESDNPGWTYDPVTRIATYNLIKDETLDGSLGTTPGWASEVLNIVRTQLKLRFPSALVNTPIVNSHTVTITPKDASEYEQTQSYSYDDSITFSLNTDLPQPIRTKNFLTHLNKEVFADQITAKSQEFYSRLTIQNRSAEWDMNNLEIRDYDLDSRVQFTRVAFSFASKSGIVGLLNIAATDENGVETVVHTGINLADYANPENQFFDLPVGTREVRIFGDPNTVLLANKKIDALVYSVLTEPENVHFTEITGPLSGNPNPNYFYNTLSTSATYVSLPDVPLTSENTDYLRITKYTPEVSIHKNSSRTSLVQGSVSTVNVQVNRSNLSNENTVYSPDDIKNAVMIDILPLGFEYVPQSFRYEDFTGLPENQIQGYKVEYNKTFVDPEIIENFKGTGQTAVVYKYPNDIKMPDSTFGMSLLHSFSFDIVPTARTKEGINRNNAYFIFDNNDDPSNANQVIMPAPTQIQGYQRHIKYIDELDLDNDGITTESFSQSFYDYTFTPTELVIANKYFQGSLDEKYVPTGSKTEIDSEGSYRLEVFNNSIKSVTQLSLVDVLPYKDDLSISPNESGEYIPRNSEFDVLLSGPIVVPEGYEVLYNLELPNQNITDYANSLSWVKTVDDYSLVKAIKINLLPGYELGLKETISFEVPFKTPDKSTLKDGMIAYNSFAISENNGANWLETLSSSVEIVNYQVSGNVFYDLNRDSSYQQDPVEETLAGITVFLVDSSEQKVLDEEGNPISTVTDAQGNYLLESNKPGEFRVYFEMDKDKYFTTTPSDLTDELGSHVSATTELVDQSDFPTNSEETQYFVSPLFSLNLNHDTQVVNAGVYSPFGDVTIEKNLFNHANEAIVEGRTFNFEVLVNDIPYNGEYLLDDQVMTTADGKISFTNNQVVKIIDLQAESVVQVTEVDATDYAVDLEVQTVTVIERENVTITFGNTEKPLGQLTLNKVVHDANGNVIGEARDFEFVVTGPSYLEGETVVVTSGTPTLLTDLIYGTYTVEEVANEDYETETAKEAVVNITTKEATIEFINTEKPLGQLTLNKVVHDANGNIIDEARNFEFVVTGPSYLEGETVVVTSGTPTVLTDLIYGTYAVEEVVNEDYETEVAKEAVVNITTKEASVEFINTEKPLGVITIRKTVNPGDFVNGEFNFELVGPNGFKESFTLKHGEEKVFENLVYGDYVVTELESENFEVEYSQIPEITLSILEKEAYVDVTNNYVVPLIDIPINVVWVGGESPRPEVTIRLYADGVEVDVVKLFNKETHTFVGLPKTTPTGQLIVYTISEDEVDGYSTVIEGFTVTNTFIPVVKPPVKPNLPNTGSDSMMTYMLGGIGVILIGLLILKKKESR